MVSIPKSLIFRLNEDDCGNLLSFISDEDDQNSWVFKYERVYFHLLVEGEVLVLTDINVAPSYRNRGLARHVIQTLVSESNNRKIPLAILAIMSPTVARIAKSCSFEPSPIFGAIRYPN